MSDSSNPERTKGTKTRPTQADIIMAMCANACACFSDPTELAKDDARAEWPHPGDFIVVRCAPGRSEILMGWFISADTAKPEALTRWRFEDLTGVVREWHNVRVVGVPLGNPYARNQDERWQHPSLRDAPPSTNG